MGVKTKEKYEEYKKNENYPQVFNNFKHYNYEDDNKYDERFKNPHDGSCDSDKNSTDNTSKSYKIINSPEKSKTHRKLSNPLPKPESFLKNFASPDKMVMAKRKNSSKESSQDVHHVKII